MKSLRFNKIFVNEDIKWDYDLKIKNDILRDDSHDTINIPKDTNKDDLKWY